MRLRGGRRRAVQEARGRQAAIQSFRRHQPQPGTRESTAQIPLMRMGLLRSPLHVSTPSRFLGLKRAD